MRFRERSLRLRVIGAFVMLGLMVVSNFALVRWRHQQLSNDFARVELAHTLFAQIQQLDLLKFRLVEGSDAKANGYRKDLEGLIRKIDASISILEVGGRRADSPDYIGPLPDKQQPIARNLRALWATLRVKTLVLIDEPIWIEVPGLVATSERGSQRMGQGMGKKVKLAVASIETGVDNMGVASNTLIRDIEHEHDYHLGSFYLFLAGIAIVDCLLLFGLFQLFGIAVLQPLKDIGEGAKRINLGDLSVEFPLQGENEFGQVIEAIDGLRHNLQNAKDFVVNVGEGKLETEYTGIEDASSVRGDSLEGALLTMRDRMREVAKDDEERRWTNEGLAKFVHVLRQSNSGIKDLADNLLGGLVKYLHANQGSIYVAKEDKEHGTVLDIVSVYAFDKKKFLQKQLLPGEGIAGQVFLERRTQHLNDVPNDFVTITSGLGDANPRNLLVVPLNQGGEVFGILELAAFSPFAPFEVEFVERIAESMAASISEVRTNERTKELLGESQKLAEELATQEVDMRENMEQLTGQLMALQDEATATKKEVLQYKGDLEAIKAGTEGMLATASFDASGNLQEANPLYHELMGYDPGGLKGLNEKELLMDGSDEEERFVALWEVIGNGKNKTGEFMRKAKQGHPVWWQGGYVAVKSKWGKIMRVVFVGIDVTAQKQ